MYAYDVDGHAIWWDSYVSTCIQKCLMIMLFNEEDYLSLHDGWSVDDCIVCWEKMVSFIEEEWFHFAICLMHGMLIITCHVQKKELSLDAYVQVIVQQKEKEEMRVCVQVLFHACRKC